MKRILSLIVLTFLGSCALRGQANMGKTGGGPFFFLDAANVAAKDTTKGRVEIFIKIAYSELLFARYNQVLFRSQYEVNYTLADKKGNVVLREIQDKEIVTEHYEETLSDLRFHFSRLTLNIDPGEYILTVVITDKETQKFGQRKLSLPVRTFREKSIGISDLLFADKIQKDSVDDIIHILPNVFKSFDNEFKKYAVYFEIYNSKYAWKNRDSIGNLPEEKEPVRIRYRVYDKNQKIVTEDSTVREVNQFQTFSSIEIDKSKVSFGKYVLDVMVYGKNGVRATSKAIFDVRLSTFTAPSLSATAFDLDVAIKQMRHVGRNLNTDKILKGTQKEKSDFFENFWRAKDPTPGTERNEIMEEYFRRVDYANRYFTSGYREGWDTDRGMVFIILEAPDDIERHPFDNNDKPYEIWYYYQANLRLLFVDVNQIGDYELMNRQEFESYLYLRR
ncbi:MAG TPA: GWxTD domain-containing protein [bacterium]|nr:GWxTD domain-containing protein [bacterium]HMZ04037.1 GWxTD domain-containing protein [bacterium]HNB08114.1 GWxTD domain-containing protein [bacterium]HNB56239.1 GWxTD domain-containing protein [bacterium]HND76909.1 GWxTD domain-containing protein [bacterium]